MDKPKRLYKYQPVSQYSLRNLKNNHIYFNHPNDFNDPFDTFHEVKIGRLTEDVAKELYFGQGTERLLFERIEQKLAKKEEILQILALLFKTFTTFKISLFKLLNFNENDFLNKSPQDVLKERSVNNKLYDSVVSG